MPFICSFHKNFPKSIVYNLRQIEKCLSRLSNVSRHESNSLEFYASKLLSTVEYTSIQEIETDPLTFYNDLLHKVETMADMLENKYLHY